MNFVREKIEIVKCCVCQKTIHEGTRFTSLTIKEINSEIRSVVLCEKCLYRLPPDLIRDILSPSRSSSYDFGNKIISALINSKYRDLTRGCVILEKIPCVKNGNLNTECSYKFTKISKPTPKNIFIKNKNPPDIIDSVYINGRKTEGQEVR